MKFVLLAQAVMFFGAMFTMAMEMQGWVSSKTGEVASGIYLVLWGLFVAEGLLAAAVRFL